MFRILLTFASCFVATLIFAQNSAFLELENTLSPQEIEVWNANHPDLQLETISQTKPWYGVTLNNNLKIQDADKVIKNQLSVQSLRRGGIVDYRDTTPDDQFYADQWGLEKINAPQVWDYTTGEVMQATEEEIVIAILDRGYDADHPDLLPNLWTNQEEIADNGIDDDNNGYTDDVTGANMITNLGQHQISGQSIEHGTNVAGVLGAKGNNQLGVAGVAWDVKILLVSGVRDVPTIMEAYEYIMDLKRLYIQSNGERGANVLVTNFSGGVSDADVSDYPEWCQQYDELASLGILSVSAAPNLFIDYDINVDMPTRCPSEYLIVATNSNQQDQLSIAGYSATHIDIAAPGEGILTTSSGGDYTDMTGTSASTPMVAGGIALLYGLDCPIFAEIEDPLDLASLMKDAVLNGVTQAPGLQSRTKTGGRMDLAGAMLNLRESCGLSGEKLTLNLETIRTSEKGIELVEFSTLSSDDVTLSLYDVSGRLVSYDLFQNPNVWQINAFQSTNFSGLPSGLYWLVLDNGTDFITKSLIF